MPAFVSSHRPSMARRAVRIRAVSIFTVAAVVGSFALTAPAIGATAPTPVGHSTKASERRQAAESVVGTAPAQPTAPVEVPGLRTIYSDTYQQPDGSRQAVISEVPANYRDSAGDLVPIDDTLTSSAASGYAWTNKAGPYTAQFPRSLSGSPVTVSDGSNWLSYQLVGASGTAGSTSGTQVRYTNALPGVSVQETAINSGVKESLVLASAPTSALTFAVSASSGVTVALLADGSLAGSVAGKRVFTVPAPTMTDAAGENSSDVHYSLSPSSDGWTLDVVPSASWLGDASRTWPVTIDPSVVVTGSSSTLDCGMQQAHTTTSTCSASTIDVGSAGSGSADHGLIAFPGLAAALPADSLVEHANLSLYVTATTTSNTTPLNIYPVQRAFTSSATWATYDGTHAWTTGGATGTGDSDQTASLYNTAAGATVASVGGSSGTWINFYTTRLVQDWLRGATSPNTGIANDGVLIKEPSDATTNVISFTSSDSTDTAHVPTLTVAYAAQAGIRPFYSTVSHPLDDRSSDSINTASGNLNVANTDVNVSGVGLNFSVSRFYNSRQAYGTPMAPHWSMDYMARLFPQPDGSVVYQDGTNYEAPFIANSGGTTFQAPAGLNATMAKPNSSTYTITDNQTQEVDTYSNAGSGGTFYLVSRADRNGNTITYTLNSSSLPSSVTDTQGRTYTFNYTSGLLTSIVESNGPSTRTWSYGYTSGNLTSYTDPTNALTQYQYDANGELNQITDPNGDVTKITSVTTTSLGTITYGYGTTDAATTTMAYNPGSCTAPCTTVTLDNNATPTAYTTTYHLDNSDQADKVTDALNHSRSTSYDPNGNVNTFSGDTTANIFQATRDSNQNVLSEQAPHEGTGTGYNGVKTTATYATRTGVLGGTWLPDTSTDGASNMTSYGYDNNGNNTTSTPASGVTLHDYYQGTDTTHGDMNCSAKPGELCKTTNGNGNSTSYGYDANGNLTSVTPPVPLVATSRVPDGLGRTSSYTDGNSQKTSYTYDKDDRVTQVLFGGATTCTPSTGNCVTYSYDGDGNLTGRVDITGTYVFVYDHLNRATTEKLGGTTTSSVTYDQTGNVLTYTDAGGTVTYNYDAANNLLDLAEPGGSCPSPPTAPTFPSTKCTGFQYNNDNDLTQTEFPSGEIITRGYDSAGRQTSMNVYHPAGTSFVSLTYNYETSGSTDSELLQSEVDNETSITTNYGYNNLNELTSVTPGSGTSYTYTYDADGNRTKQVTTSPAATTYYGYDNADQLCWTGATSGTNGTTACPTTPSGDTANTFDGAGNQTATGANTASYNSANQTSSNTISGTTTNLSYADSGQSLRTANGTYSYLNGLLGVASETNSADGTTVYFTRTPAGDLISIRQGAGGTSTNSYYLTDYQGTVLRISTAAGTSDDAIYKYDPYGTTTSATGTLATINPYRYATGMYDGATGQLKLGQRYYSPGLGRFTQPDPTGSEANSYVYAADDPTNDADPSGCVACAQEDTTVGTTFDGSEYEGLTADVNFGTGGSAFAYLAFAVIVGIKDGHAAAVLVHHSGGLFDANHHSIDFTAKGFSEISGVFGEAIFIGPKGKCETSVGVYGTYAGD